jgi:transposase-like protein
MAHRQRDPVRERLWRKHVAGWQAGGLSIRAYCRQHDLAETAFRSWRQELRRRDAATPTSPPPRPAFAPVVVVPDPEPADVSPEPQSSAAIEVRCPSGHVVILPLGAEEATLRRLFAALAAGPTPAGEASPC